jgi:hypothetical protein
VFRQGMFRHAALQPANGEPALEVPHKLSCCGALFERSGRGAAIGRNPDNAAAGGGRQRPIAGSLQPGSRLRPRSGS